jgi:actin-like ATPase involved in cell morphogenesis
MLHRTDVGDSRNLTQRQDFISAANAQRCVEENSSLIAHTNNAPHTKSSTPVGLESYDFYRTPCGVRATRRQKEGKVCNAVEGLVKGLFARVTRI